MPSDAFVVNANGVSEVLFLLPYLEISHRMLS